MFISNSYRVHPQELAPGSLGSQTLVHDGRCGAAWSSFLESCPGRVIQEQLFGVVAQSSGLAQSNSAERLFGGNKWHRPSLGERNGRACSSIPLFLMA